MGFKDGYRSISARIYSDIQNKRIEKICVHISDDDKISAEIKEGEYHITVPSKELHETWKIADEFNEKKKIERENKRAKEIEASKNKKRNVKKPSNKKWIAPTAVVLAVIAPYIIYTEAENSKAPTPPSNGPTSSYAGDSVPTTKQNEIDTSAEVKKDFVNDYLDAYNKVYGTNYKSGEMVVKALKADAVYELDDGRKVTRGKFPYETEKVLNNIGKFGIARINSEVAQILVNGKILGTYNISNGEFIYSGNQLSDLTDEEYKAPKLEDLGIDQEKLEAAARVALAKGGVESKESIDNRIKDYNYFDMEK